MNNRPKDDLPFIFNEEDWEIYDEYVKQVKAKQHEKLSSKKKLRKGISAVEGSVGEATSTKSKPAKLRPNRRNK